MSIFRNPNNLVLIDEDAVLKATANAIRAKKSVSTTYTVSEMAAAITSISGSLASGTIVLTDKTVTYDVTEYANCLISDENLKPSNIKTGITILGITGAGPIETSDATATAAKIKKNKKAWVNGTLLTGTAEVTVTGTTLNLPF